MTLADLITALLALVGLVVAWVTVRVVQTHDHHAEDERVSSETLHRVRHYPSDNTDR